MWQQKRKNTLLALLLAGVTAIACEGPIGGTATLHVDAAMPNFAVQEICGGVRPSTPDSPEFRRDSLRPRPG